MKREAGFTMVELMVTMVVFVLVIAAASSIFTGLLTQFKQQSKMAETNIEGIIGLEILRHDIEHAGYGLPWDVVEKDNKTGDPVDANANGNRWDDLSNYLEAISDTGRPVDPATFNDGGPASSLPVPANVRRAPRAILGGNNLGVNFSATSGGSDYLVIKAVNVAINIVAQKWTHLMKGALGEVKTVWTPDCENVNKYPGCTTDNTVRVAVISPGDEATGGRFLVVSDYDTDNDNDLFTQYRYTSYFAPSDSLETRVIYGVDPDTDLRMPFNRADYYTRRPTTTMPSRCAKNTGVLYKATLNHGDGKYTELPLLDCVADMQVVYRRDTDADGTIDNTTDDISALTAQQIRDEVKEIRVYILAHEGQKDPNYTHSPTVIYVGDPDIGSGRNFDIGTNVNYRWKLYWLVVRPGNLR